MYIAVFHPRKSPSLCQPNNARKIVGGLTIVACLIYVYAFWIAKMVRTTATGNKFCLIVQEDAMTAMILSIIDTILTLVIPFTMILFMITRLFVHISKFYQAEFDSAALSSNTENSDGQQGDSATACCVNPTVRQANEAYTKLTRMLVVTVVVFLVLNLPSHAIKVQFLFRSFLSENVHFTPTEGFIQIVFQMLYYANFSVNFLLYSACGRSFRHAMFRMTLNLQHRIFPSLADCRRKFQNKGKKGNTINDSQDRPNEGGQAQQHSRLVDIHLNEMRYSQLPSLESQFVCKSPPCLLVCESEHLIEEGH
ncbi:7 transmembrane receptor (rhodopsin) [Mactra antiquata]